MNLMMKGDCLLRMQEIEAGSVDMVLTDIPYSVTQCHWDSIIPFEPMWENIYRVIKRNAAIALFGTEPFSSALRLSNQKDYKYDWVWQKSRPSGFLNAKKQPLRSIENISIFYQEQCLYQPQGISSCNKQTSTGNSTGSGGTIIYNSLKPGTYTQTSTGYPRQVLTFPSVGRNNTLHPTQKPVDLLEYLVKTYTREGMTVLDFTAGSFSTAIAALNTGRKFIGIEMDKDYFDAGVQRVQEHITKLDIEPVILL
ncbi:MAG: DNA methyltransferase [Bacilli bacterium]